jgi:opacity protein-like surface antigen
MHTTLKALFFLLTAVFIITPSAYCDDPETYGGYAVRGCGILKARTGGGKTSDGTEDKRASYNVQCRNGDIGRVNITYTYKYNRVINKSFIYQNYNKKIKAKDASYGLRKFCGCR